MPPSGMASSALRTRFNTARRNISRSAVTARSLATSMTALDRLGRQLRSQRGADVVDQPPRKKVCRCGSRSDVKFNRSFTVASSAVEASLDLVQHVEAAAIVRHPPPQQAQVQRDGDQVVADLVGNVRGHPAQIGQAVLPGQLAVLDLELLGQPATCSRRPRASLPAARWRPARRPEPFPDRTRRRSASDRAQVKFPWSW